MPRRAPSAAIDGPAVPANRVEAALFDAADDAERAAQQADEAAELAAHGPAGYVQVTGLPPEASPQSVADFFAGCALRASVRDDVIRLVPGAVGAALGGARHAGRLDAFVAFQSSDVADAAIGQHLASGSPRFRLNRQAYTLEIFRTTAEYIAHTLAAAEAEAAAKAKSQAAEEAAAEKAAAEAARLVTIEAARAARAAEKERHRRDAEMLKASQDEAAKAARAARTPYALSEGKENVDAAGGSSAEGGGGIGSSAASASIVSVSAESGEVLTLAPGCGLRGFNFQRVFDVDAKQEHVYELCGRAAVADVLNGHSACVLVYGQTGAGKTHTMFGDGTADVRRGSSHYGLVPRVCEQLVDATRVRTATLGLHSELRVAYVEVFGSEVTDLLREGASIGAAADGADNSFHAHRWVLEGRADVPFDSCDGALDLIARGDKCKRKAATAMNERSSRAHALFIISLTQTSADGVAHTTRLFLADLGGSEKLTKSQAADDFKSLVITSGGEEISRISWAEYYQHRAKLQESLNINVGLYALQRCIESLIQREALKGHGGAPMHIPFADSKLTLLLKDALNGGARTTVLVCASLEPRNAVESIQSLRFGEACGRIEMRGKGAGEGAAALKRLVAEIDDEIAATQAIIVRDQRWEKRTTMRYDTVDIKDNFTSAVTTDFANAEVDLGAVAAGVTVVDVDLDALRKGGVTRFSKDELRAALLKRGLDAAGDKTALFERLRDALSAAAETAATSKKTIAHEVVANVLVGAEEAEAKLEKLLQKKRELLGEA